MKANPTVIIVATLLFLGLEAQSQFVNGNRYGRQRNTIPQTPTAQKEPEKLTAEEYVDQEMPNLIKVMSLDPFEEAVVRSVLVKSVQKRMELQILKLEPKKMKEEFENIVKTQDAELKAGLPEEKYQIYLEMQKKPNQNQTKTKKEEKET